MTTHVTKNQLAGEDACAPSPAAPPWSAVPLHRFRKATLCFCIGKQLYQSGAGAPHSKVELFGGRNYQLLTHLKFVGVDQHAAVCIEDSHVLIRIPIKLLADLRKVVAAFHFICFPAALAATSSRPNCSTRVDAQVSGNIVSIRIDQFDSGPRTYSLRRPTAQFLE